MNSGIIKTCERVGLVLGTVAVLVSAASGQALGLTLGVFLGAVLAMANLVVIRRMVSSVLESHAGGEQRSSGAISVLFIGKVALLVAFVWFAVKVIGATPMGLILGVSAVFASVIAVSIGMGFRSPDSMIADLETTSATGQEPT